MIILFIGVLLIVISRSAASLVKMEHKNLQLVNLLQSQKSELESILSRTNDGVYTLDKNLRITSANAKALESVSKSASEVLGRHVTTVFVDPQLAQFYQSSLEKAFATQENSEVVVHSKMLNRWFFNNIFPNEHGITTFYKEITAQKLAEIELNKAKEHFRTLFT